MIKFGIVGVGYWGPNLARNLNQVDGGTLQWICDQSDKALGGIAKNHPHVTTTKSLEEMLKGDVDAVTVATPAATHYDIATTCLNAGKHVLVEKPLAMTSQECSDLIERAANKNLVLMVGHTFLYSPPVLRLKQYVDAGDLGEIYYAYSTRVNLGQVRKDVNALWNLAPHDISILLYLFGEAPTSANARGISYIRDGVEDVVFLYLDFPGKKSGHVHVSWLDPGKVREMTVVGSQKMIVYDDVSPDAKIQIFDKGVDKISGPPQAAGSFGEYQLLLRAGDIHIPKVPATEPLKLECQHFADCIANGTKPRTDGEHGRVVVQVLEAAQRSLRSGGGPVEVGR
jgi:predicted dehydrogenase